MENNPHAVDWANLAAVKRYADTLGAGHSVVLRPGRTTFNVMHTSREGELRGEIVVYRTKTRGVTMMRH